MPDKVDRPHVFWWFVVLGGLTILGLQAFSPRFYAWWTQHANPLPGQGVMLAIFIACIPIHIFEAIYVYRVARKLGLRHSAVGWSVQTLFLGFPSTRLINKRAKAVA